MSRETRFSLKCPPQPQSWTVPTRLMSGNIGLYLARPRLAPPHSCLSATRGSTRAARRAGSQHATRAIAIHTATAADQVTASVGLTPWSSVASSRDARAEISKPMATPAAVTRKP